MFGWYFQSKLIKLFSKQLVAKAKLATDGRTDVNEKLSEYPHTEQWLNVVGVQSEAIKVATFPSLPNHRWHNEVTQMSTLEVLTVDNYSSEMPVMENFTFMTVQHFGKNS